MSLKHTLHNAYEEYEDYVLTALVFDDTEIDSFAEWAGRHYGLHPTRCTEWESYCGL